MRTASHTLPLSNTRDFVNFGGCKTSYIGALVCFALVSLLICQNDASSYTAFVGMPNQGRGQFNGVSREASGEMDPGSVQYTANQDPLLSCGTTLQINAPCVRVLEGFRSPRVGLGHQISELVFSLQLASLYDAAVLFSPFKDDVSEHGDTLTFLNDLLGLKVIWRNSNYDTSALRVQLISNSSSDPYECDVIYKGTFMTCPGTLDWPGQSGNCFLLPAQRSSFNRFAPCLRELAMSSGTWTHKRPTLLSTNSFNVVWHVRLGDLELHKPDDGYYENISRLLQPTFLAVNGPRHFVIGKWDVLEIVDLQAYETHFRELLGKITFLNVELDESFIYMLHADMVIGSGSSLPRVASLFSSSVLPVNMVPTHGWNHYAEYYSDGIDIELENDYITPTPAILKKIQEKSKGNKLRRPTA